MRKLSVFALMLALPACGGGSTGPTMTPTATPDTRPARATVSVAQTTVGQICISPLADKTIRVRIPMRISETAGLGVNVNFIRLQLSKGATDVERAEMTATDVSRILGSNHINASSVANITMSHDFNASGDEWDTLRYTFGLTDDRGNDVSVVLGPPFNVVVALFCTI
jgi:hypothetical protein